ncbi:hypothetical protein [Chryseobacterium sp. MEBOG07]|uniref:hypothetical protein n=1 Tax=Chryseobacterium sp. MEBOG07 TaxID=2879939 RepID=UPI001F200E85|nr:hypothetical protein [Chryseobacterium sp. MEBOG07]UKB78969.1 hypothetical protein LF886_21420 [Chryseobacterium sp. MEBOG07]
MKTKLLSVALIAMSLFTFAQVGIQTPTPKKTLHVNGGLQVVKDINVGGDGSTTGSSGTAGDFLSTNGTGNAPEWKSLDSQSITKMVFIGNKNNTDPAPPALPYAGGQSNTLRYNVVNKILNTYISYDSNTGIFTVNKAGFYSVNTYLTYDLHSNPSGQTGGTATSTIDKVGDAIEIAKMSTNHSERSEYVYHTLTGIRLFAVGDTFKVTGDHTRQYRLVTSNFQSNIFQNNFRRLYNLH